MKKSLPFILLAIFTLLQQKSFAQTILLQEDFSLETLPQEWANDSLGNPALHVWEFNNPGGRTILGSNFDTSFVILDSDNYGQGDTQNASLTTDTISAAGFTGLVLEFDEQYYTQSLGGSLRKIEASGDGVNWYTVDSSIVSVGYPIAIHSSFNLDTLAGAAGVMIRFTYTGTWDYWWGLDNMKVTGYIPCTTPPVAGQALSSHASVCAGTDFNLLLSGNDAGTGISYQWQYSADSIAWSDLSGAVSAQVATSQSASTYYRCLVTCSGQSDSTALVFVDMNLSNLCYCIPQTPSCSNINFISVVSIKWTTLNNISSCQENDSGYAYVSYPASGNTTATVHQNGNYDFTVGSTGNNIISLWIDYDQSGTFDTTEWYRVTTSSVQQTPTVITIQIPDSVPQGLTGMRIRTRSIGNTNGPADACTAFASGETEDYYLYIDTLLSGIHELTFADLLIYPNPAAGDLNIDFGKFHWEKLTLTLYNLLGSTIREQQVEGVKTAGMSVADLAEGIYLLKINDGTAFAVRKVVVKRN